MKHLTLTLALLGALFFSQAHAAVSPDLINSNLVANQAVTGSDTYALASALTGVASSYIDLANYGGMVVGLTGSAGIQVNVQWNSLTYTTWIQGPALNAQSGQFVGKVLRYARFQVNPAGQAGTKATVWYSLAPLPTAQGSAAEVAALTATSAALASLNGAYLDVSSTSATGVTTNAAVTRSLTFVASIATGMLDLDIIGCAGATTVYYKVHDGVTPPAFYTTNPTQGSAFLCGTTHLIEPRRFMGANPHITFYAAGLSATSATVSFGLLSRTAQ